MPTPASDITLLSLCQAVIAINDEASGIEVLNQIYRTSLNVNDPAMPDGRCLIDVAVEKLCANFDASKKDLNVELVHRELYIISTIFSLGANFDRNQHAITKGALQLMEDRYKVLYRKMTAPGLELKHMFSQLTPDELILTAAYHAFDEIICTANNTADIINQALAMPKEAGNIRAKMQHKALVICETLQMPEQLNFSRR